ncbi:hypothetical protein [Streptomyces sp. NPDC102264]|uniref:hypothetical protein n=1 Tax=Streptomyces sp. NPDC102264 TaxID=3366149 RepID=UPI0038194299
MTSRPGRESLGGPDRFTGNGVCPTVVGRVRGVCDAVVLAGVAPAPPGVGKAGGRPGSGLLDPPR